MMRMCHAKMTQSKRKQPSSELAKLVIQQLELLLRHPLHIVTKMLTIVQVQINILSPRMLDRMQKFFDDQVLAVSLVAFTMMIKAKIFKELVIREHTIVFDLTHVQFIR